MTRVEHDTATVPPTDLTASFSESGKTSPTRKPRRFRIPQSAVLNVPEPSPTEPRTWVRDIVTGGQTTEVCPEFCTFSHDADRVGFLDDLVHSGDDTAVHLTIRSFRTGEPTAEPVEALRVQIRLDPYSDNPRRRQPFATLELLEDEMADELGPEELLALLRLIRDHLDDVEYRVVPQLIAARAAWARKGGGR
ncbi:DUF6907 domain-containing protein [Streptomyces sp. NPDC020983]|uniref:DUF6907 domain-containing protein n=1 Tax=Streptomyces sp. NPDC020983 TaxID=3365106 RepID=UPI0037A6A92A